MPRDTSEKRKRQYQEINEYRDLLQAPDRFESGFTAKTIVGVLFIAFIMTPGQMYLSLVTGIGIGEAAQWVTVILFLEIAKRSFTTLRRQEIFLLTYVASQLIVRAETGTFLQLIWRQYFVGSQEAVRFGLQEKLVNLKFMGYSWFSPSPDSAAIVERTFFHVDWALPIGLLVMGIIVARVTWFTSGYVLFRLVSDREQLPFPTAPQSALASMALAEESGSEEQTWKWPCFLIGATIGMVFGLIYVGVPALTETFAGKKVTVLPIPFADLTPMLGRFVGATPIAISFSLAPIFAGLLLPFWSVMGSFAGVLLFMITSPLLHHYGFMPRWVPGMGAVQTQIVAGVDFWQPFGMGITLAVAVISITQVIRAGRERREDRAGAARSEP
ncbi:MAG: peptide transporter, partial [Candidatus Latescibacterota bacterium]|nr:peptide transporter [Candidatus Latescibacterota bacterium]